MSKKTDDWMPLRIGIYLRDTPFLTRDQHGAYFLLLMAYWTNGGPLPSDDAGLAATVKATAKEWRKIKPVMLRFFTEADGLWHQKRADEELAVAREITDAKSKAGQAGGIAARGKSGRKRIADELQTNSSGNSKTIAEPIANEWQKNTPLPLPVPLPEVGNGRQAAVTPPQEPLPGRRAGKIDDPWKEVYDYGKQILGASSGGIITNLRKTFGDKPKKVMGKIEDASRTERPLEWINAFLWEHGPAGIQVGAIG